MVDPLPRPRRLPSRTLRELVSSRSDLRLPAGADGTVAVSGISLDSRTVRPGDLYLARAGAVSHGIDHTAQALAAGAVAILTDPVAAAAVAGDVDVPVLVTDDPRAAAGPVAAWIYGDPGAAMLTLGITGTNGKTTTAWYADAGLRAAGRRTGLIGTVSTVIDGEAIASVRTTPESTDLQALFAVMRERGVDAVTMEVSSHALALGRVSGARFDVAGFTNLSQDHLDFHGDLESYFATKAELFTPAYSDTAIVTVDDEWGRRLAAQTSIPVTTLSGSPDVAADWSWEPVAGGLRLFGAGTGLDLRVALPGRFNLANAALAALLLRTAGIPDDAIAGGIGGLRVVPGRMQPVAAGQDFAVIVDYAHTPDAVSRIVAEARDLAAPGGRVWIVIGSGGDRDPGKRPVMGRAAAAADRVIVTDDNPRSEDPAAIRAAVLAGARAAGAGQAEEIGDRRAAIGAALQGAGAGDVVLIAGKGHEATQDVGGVITAFDDAAVAEELLLARDQAAGPVSGGARP